MALLITIGDTNKDYLRLKVPAKGEQNWSQDFKTEFALKIAEHDHTGNGKGLQITTEALKDNAVTGAKLNANINDLNDVAVSTASAGNILRYNGSMWVGEPQEATSNVLTIDEQDNTVYSWEPEMLDNVYMFLSGGEDADLTAKSTSSAGDPVVIDSVIITAYSPDNPKKVILLPSMKNCIIKGKVNLNVQGNLENCIIDIDGDIFTNALYGFDSCTIKATSIQNLSAPSNSTNTVFTDCKIDVQTLTSDLTSGDTNKIKFVDSTINVAGSFSNSSALDITDLNTAHLELDNSQVRVHGRLENLFGFLLDAESFLIAENYAENNKERVSLTLNRLDIGLFTKTIKDVDIRLTIDLTGENILPTDPITSYSEAETGSVEISNYVKKNGATDTGNFWRSYASFFNLTTSLDNVTMNVFCENYTYNGTVMDPDLDRHLHVLYLPKVVKDSKIVVNEIEGLGFKHHSSLFQVHENQDFSNYTGTDYTIHAPARFQIIHTGQVKLLNTTIGQNRGNELLSTDYDPTTEYFGCQYRLTTALQNPLYITSLVQGCTFNIKSVVFRDNVHVENCTSTCRNFYIGDDSALTSSIINAYEFRIQSINDITNSNSLNNLKIYRCEFNLFNLKMSQGPAGIHDITFNRCHINAVAGNIRTGSNLGLYFQDCNLNFSSYFRNNDNSDNFVVMRYCNFKTPWIGNGQKTRTYCLDSNLDAGKVDNRCDFMNHQSKVEIGKINSGLLYLYKNYGGDSTTYGPNGDTTSGYTRQGSMPSPTENIIFSVDGYIKSNTGTYTYKTLKFPASLPNYKSTINVTNSMVKDDNTYNVYGTAAFSYSVYERVSGIQNHYTSNITDANNVNYIPPVPNTDGNKAYVRNFVNSIRAQALPGDTIQVKVDSYIQQTHYKRISNGGLYQWIFRTVFEWSVLLNGSVVYTQPVYGPTRTVTSIYNHHENWENNASSIRATASEDYTVTGNNRMYLQATVDYERF